MRPGLIHHGLERAAARWGDRTAILAGDERYSFAALENKANALARLIASRGVGPGQRVALMMGNRPEFLVTVEAVSKLGASSVLVNPAWKRLEVGHALELTGARHGVADADAAPLLRERLGDAVTDVDQGGNPSDGGPFSGGAGDADADAVLVFSSGTTGMPKAVRHTHRSMGYAIDHWVQALGLGPHDRFQVATPPSHILGLLNLVTAVAAGASVRLHRRFDLDEILERIQDERMTLEMAVAPIALAMANHPQIEKYDLSSLRFIMWGATPVTASVADTVTRRTGVRWLPAYGASEVPVITANPVADPGRWRLDSAGLPVAGVELRIAELETGEILPAGETGEVQVRSPSLMAGYVPDDANAQAFAGDWYRTGDVGWLEPEGWLHITDRSKEMIKVSGFQVAPAELEAVLLGHPGVVDCAVFGVADQRAGEVPVAAVQVKPDQPPTAEELMQLVDRSLAKYKRLRQVMVVDTIPRLPSGKVLRRTLRAEWERHSPTGREV